METWRRCLSTSVLQSVFAERNDLEANLRASWGDFGRSFLWAELEHVRPILTP